MHADAVDHVNLAFPADRLDEVIDFYVDRLGFETRFDDPHAAVADDPGLFPIAFGDDASLFVAPREDWERESNFRHVAVRVPLAPEEVEARLDDADIDVDNTAERERETTGPYTSYYVTDPFGYGLELMAVGD